MKSIPYFYHQTTLIVVDDDSEFLNAWTLALSEHFKCYSFTSPILAEKFLFANCKKNLAKKHNYLNIVYEDLSEFSVRVEVAKIHAEVFDKERFKKTCVLIVDYDMPEMNGLDFIRLVKQQLPFLKIIMLTGEADQETAIHAFNDKEIDRFIAKSAHDYYEKIIDYIIDLQHEYFAEMSRGVLESLNSKGGHPTQDKDFIDLFTRLYLKNKISEYYLLDESGSFLMLDATGNQIWLMVRTEEDMRTYYELAEGEHLEPHILQALADREKIIFFPHAFETIPPITQWIIKKAIQLKNKKIYYCICKENHKYGLNLKNILSYDKFLNSKRFR